MLKLNWTILDRIPMDKRVMVGEIIKCEYDLGKWWHQVRCELQVLELLVELGYKRVVLDLALDAVLDGHQLIFYPLHGKSINYAAASQTFIEIIIVWSLLALRKKACLNTYLWKKRYEMPIQIKSRWSFYTCVI